MSDKGSESSGEWVILDENEELCLDNEENQPLNLQLSYDAVCDAVSESIISSLSGEELEWQYEQFQDLILSSCIEELDYPDFDAESIEDFDVRHTESDDLSKCASASDLEDEKSVDFSSGSKYHCYKHTRNEQLNFILNLMLVIVLASTVGLGIGHFLGWSHNCHKSTTKHNAAYSPNIYDSIVHSSQLPSAVTIMQNVESFANQEQKVVSRASFSENLSDISCLDSKNNRISLNEKSFNDIATDPALPETSIPTNEVIQELKTEEINQKNFSDVGLSHISNIVAHMDWNKVDHITETFNNLNKPLERSNIQRVPSIGTEKTAPEKLFLSNIPLFGTEKSISEEMSTSSSFDFKGTESGERIELLKQVYVKDNESYKESNLTDKLRRDLREVIQSLTTIVLARFTQGSDNNPLLIENSGLIVNYYAEFENLVNLRLSEIDNFVMSSEYKRYEKVSLKHLQKMVYSLIDSVDYLMKVSIKTLSMHNKTLIVHKYLNNIDKVIFTFNKRWEKNNRYWSETVRKINFQELKEKSFKKEHKHWKKKSQFEKDFRNKKYQRYSMKS